MTASKGIIKFRGRRHKHLTPNHIFIDALRDVLDMSPIHGNETSDDRWDAWPGYFDAGRAVRFRTPQ